jgi:hypothetical protein
MMTGGIRRVRSGNHSIRFIGTGPQAGEGLKGRLMSAKGPDSEYHAASITSPVCPQAADINAGPREGPSRATNGSAVTLGKLYDEFAAKALSPTSWQKIPALQRSPDDGCPPAGR